MIITLTFFQVSTLITALASLFLGLFVYLAGEKTKLNFSWLLNSLVISVWSVGLFGVVFSTSASIAWFWQYVLDIGGICIPLLYFNFLLHLLKKKKELIGYQIFSLTAGTLLIILNFTNLFKTGVSSKFGINFWIDPGKLYFLFPLYFFLIILLSTIIIIREYRVITDRDKKRQLVYMLVAQVFGFGGGLTDFFPQLFNVYPFGNYFIILYVIFIGYAALKHHLFNLKVIATELLTFSIWAFLLIRTLLSRAMSEFLLNGTIFAAVVAAGVLLVRSVIKEVEQREKIEKIEKEIERAYDVEKKANEELKNLDKFKNQFLMQAQHDMRSPLGVLMGYSDLLLGGSYGKLTKKSSDIIERMQVVIQNKIKDVNNFLDIEQFRMGRGVVTLKPGIELTHVLEEIAVTLNPKAQAKGIYLRFEKPEAVIAVAADREKLRAALFNIIDNAIKYTPNGGVEIKVKTIVNVAQIEVKDTGIGIPQDKVKGILDGQFERTQQAQKTAAGSGVGLYLSGQIIKLHNGKVWAESAGEGKGSVFYIELPVN